MFCGDHSRILVFYREIPRQVRLLIDAIKKDSVSLRETDFMLFIVSCVCFFCLILSLCL